MMWKTKLRVDYEHPPGVNMLLCFRLSMPKNNSWNGRWTGEGKHYNIIRHVKESETEMAKTVLECGKFSHDFGDGWVAAVHVQTVNCSDAEKLRELSDGFSGYDWMIDSIMDNGEIVC